jgi:uncharacterized OB-fold protein
VLVNIIVVSLVDGFNYPNLIQDAMKEFLDFLRKGKFRIPFCLNCNSKVWPPANICSKCYSKKIRMSELESNGRLIEHASSHIGNSEKLGLIEISGIRLIGILSEDLNPGSNVKLTRCGLDKDNFPYYEFSSA